MSYINQLEKQFPDIYYDRPNTNKLLPGPVDEYNFNKNKLKSVNETLNRENVSGDYILPDIYLRKPSQNNPFMNVPITNYDTEQTYTDYNRYKRPNIPSVETENISDQVQNNFTNNLFQDAGSYFFQKDNSQRQFYSVPVGSVPNEQDSFANWLYSVPKNCKNGSIFMRYGLKYTDDSLMCNGYNVAEPTNFGHLK